MPRVQELQAGWSLGFAHPEPAGRCRLPGRKVPPLHRGQWEVSEESSVRSPKSRGRVCSHVKGAGKTVGPY